MLYEIKDQRRSYDVILILEDGGYSVANLLEVSGLATSDMSEGLKLSQYQISTSISMHCPDITNSGFLKQMTAILKLYFRFRF